MNYDDIINLPHHVSPYRAHMDLAERAAQFSPFAALTGYEAAIQESARLTDDKIQLEDSELELLNARLWLLQQKLAQKPLLSVTYFSPDEKKDGGTYLTKQGIVKRIDLYEHQLQFTDGTSIAIADISNIDGALFQELSE